MNLQKCVHFPGLPGACDCELVECGCSDWLLVTVAAFTSLFRDPVLLHANWSLHHVVFLSMRLCHPVCISFFLILLYFILRLGFT